MGGKVPKSVWGKKHPLNKYKFVDRMPDASCLTLQADAKQYLPPGAYIWKANSRCAWVSRLPPHSEHAFPWSGHGNQSESMVKAVRDSWSLYLADNCLPESHCPIKGIFN